MQNNDVKKLVIGLEADSPFVEDMRLRHFPRKKVLSPADRQVYPLKNPAFVFDLADSYARAQQPLPAQVSSASVWRLYSHLRYGEKLKYIDPDGCEAIALADSSNSTAQALIEGLICSGLSHEAVAKRCGRVVTVIELYASWFFDFTDRRDDVTFVASVLNPGAELSLVPSESSPSPVLLARQLGYNLGPEAVVREVVRELRLTHERNVGAKGDQSANIKRILLSQVHVKATMGLLDKNDAGFVAFKSLATAQAKQAPKFEDEDMRMGFGRISASQSCQLIIKQVTQRAALEKLKAAREFDAEQAAESLKKTMASQTKSP